MRGAFGVHHCRQCLEAAAFGLGKGHRRGRAANLQGAGFMAVTGRAGGSRTKSKLFMMVGWLRVSRRHTIFHFDDDDLALVNLLMQRMVVDILGGIGVPKCNRCGHDVFIASRDGYCGDCEDLVRKQERKQRLQNITLTTSIGVPNRDIDAVLGIVASEVAVGQNIFKDIGNSIRDFVGGRSSNVQNALKQARHSCLADLKQEAFDLGADAVIAVDLDYNEASTGSAGGILFVAATGTAVKLKG